MKKAVALESFFCANVFVNYSLESQSQRNFGVLLFGLFAF
jgi:hypothetical protein